MNMHARWTLGYIERGSGWKWAARRMIVKSTIEGVRSTRIWGMDNKEGNEALGRERMA